MDAAIIRAATSGPDCSNTVRLRLVDEINTLVMTKYLDAKNNGNLTFSSTEMTTVKSRNGTVFQLRYCPALSKKPTAGKTRPNTVGAPDAKPDPFENPSEELLVAGLPDGELPTHHLILNKYPVIPGHSIVSTVDFKRQNDLLESLDLSVTYACLKAWEAKSSSSRHCRLFAFFNSGKHSGASQPHRHLQLLPVEQMEDSSSPGWTPLIDIMSNPLPFQPGVTRIAGLPFQHFAKRIPQHSSTSTLETIYHALRDIAQESITARDKEGLAHDSSGHGSSDSFSYNLAMTLDTMALCPRRSETASISTRSGESLIALNGTLLAGTMMVKEQDEWDALRSGGVLVDDILDQVGFQS